MGFIEGNGQNFFSSFLLCIIFYLQVGVFEEHGFYVAK
jgi:hypothetical protein